MPIWYKIVKFFLPTLKLQHVPQWIPLWEQKQRLSFLTTSRAIYLFAAAAYPAHYFFIDVPLNKDPAIWLPYRLSMGVFGLALFALTHASWFRSRRILLVIFGYVMCYFQVRSMIWHDGVPYFYAFVMASLITAFMQKPVGWSLIYLGSIFAVQWPSFLQTTVPQPYLVSAAIMSVIVVVALRSRMSAEIDIFIEEQTHLETQKKLIESEMELNTQIRAFLPGEIYARVMNLIQTQNLPVHAALEEVLRLRNCTVACIFTDIRGFTRKTKNVSGFIFESVSPNLRASTAMIESYHGIPRLIGDLIFTYFDSKDGPLNLLRALECSVALLDQCNRMNQSLSPEMQIQRYLSLSYGEAAVGNVGGSDGSREITVLGNPANILSRIDELTKKPEVAAALKADHLILSSQAAQEIKTLYPALELHWIDVHALQASIRDFPEEKFIALFPAHEANRKQLQHILSTKPKGTLDHDQDETWRKAI